jgi:hypothetical protein
MLIEFDTVRSSTKEHWERDIQEELGNTPPFERSDDYKTRVTLDMDRIVDFTGASVWFNDKRYECVLGFDKDGLYTIPLLISYDDFKKVFEYAKGVKIFRHEEI